MTIVSMSRDEYDLLERLNFSKLKHIGRSPAHFKSNAEGEGEDTDALKRGRATHLALYEPERFEREVVVYRDRRNSNAWRDFEAANWGREILTVAMYDAAIAMAKAVRESPMAQPYLGPGPVEQTVLWRHEVEGLPGMPGRSYDCKARLDKILDWGCIVDLKSTRDASPERFARQAYDLDYYVQAAWYRDAYQAATGKLLPYALIAVEAAPPWVVQVYRVPDELLERGRERYRDFLARLSLCEREGSWPGYAQAPLDLELPPWLRDRDDVEDEAEAA